MQEIFIHFAKLDFIELIQGGKEMIYRPGSAAVDGSLSFRIILLLKSRSPLRGSGQISNSAVSYS